MGMTAAKIAITLPPEQLARAKQAVQSGRAESVSAFIVKALVEQEQEDSLQALVDDLIAEHGEPSAEDRAWAKRVLRPKRRRK